MTDTPGPPGGHLLVYQSDDGRVRLEVRLQHETVWLTQSDLARLFGCSADNIALHIRNIFAEGELDPKATTEDSSVVRQEGQRQVRRTLTYYNLDVIISVGYRVKSTVATRFRIWATQRLRELIVKGFTIDDERLKEPANDRYFEELLARIRDIRSSEKVFWRKVLDLYATSIDYDPQSPATQDLFKRIQNQMHWAAHGHTAAEVIMQRADADQPLMGITHVPGSMLFDAVPFTDLGAVAGRVQQFDRSPPNWALGTGLRVGFERNAIFRIDLARSPEQFAVNIDFGMPF
jgi:hypothetical protein